MFVSHDCHSHMHDHENTGIVCIHDRLQFIASPHRTVILLPAGARLSGRYSRRSPSPRRPRCPTSLRSTAMFWFCTCDCTAAVGNLGSAIIVGLLLIIAALVLRQAPAREPPQGFSTWTQTSSTAMRQCGMQTAIQLREELIKRGSATPSGLWKQELMDRLAQYDMEHVW